MLGEEKKLVLLQYDDHVATITLNNPPANVLSQEVIEELLRTFNELEHTDITAVIITGQGSHSFSAGADIKELVQREPMQNQEYFTKIYLVFNLIANCRCPVIAALNGYAYGAGLELALCTDIRVMDQDAKLSAVCVNLNLVFGTQRLVRLAGLGRAKDLIFCARQVNAHEALDYGLVEHIAAPGTSWEKAREIAMLISQKGQTAVRGVKRVLNQGVDLPLNEALELETKFLYRMLASNEFAGRAKKFLCLRV